MMKRLEMCDCVPVQVVIFNSAFEYMYTSTHWYEPTIVKFFYLLNTEVLRNYLYILRLWLVINSWSTIISKALLDIQLDQWQRSAPVPTLIASSSSSFEYSGIYNICIFSFASCYFFNQFEHTYGFFLNIFGIVSLALKYNLTLNGTFF